MSTERKDQTSEITNATTATLDSFESYSAVRICGYIHKLKEIKDKRGDLIAFGDLEDPHGFIRVLIPKGVLMQYRETLHSKKEIIISGTFELSEPFSMIRAVGVEYLK
jgi:DNA polymerase III alpha subunit